MVLCFNKKLDLGENPYGFEQLGEIIEGNEPLFFD
jgi:hypothetical protein